MLVHLDEFIGKIYSFESLKFLNQLSSNVLNNGYWFATNENAFHLNTFNELVPTMLPDFSGFRSRPWLSIKNLLDNIFALG